MYRSICLIILSLFISCNSGQPKYKGPLPAGKWLKSIEVSSSIDGQTLKVPVQIYFPKNYDKNSAPRTIILLHQYNKNKREWERYSRVENYADRYNFVLVSPDMGRSSYETKFYAETTIKWKNYPGTKWIGDYLVPFLKDQFGLCRDRNSTAIAGVSMGGRGALLVAENYPEKFKAAGAFSGIYVTNKMKSYTPFINSYGSYKEFKSRWDNDDNILRGVDKLSGMAVYIGHGQKDSLVPYKHARVLAITLNKVKKGNSSFKYKYNEKKSGKNDWNFWNYLMPDLFQFLNNNMK